MEIAKTNCENIVETKDLVVVNEDNVKSDVEEKNCDKMVANIQDNLVTASEVVVDQEQQQQQPSISKLELNIPDKEIEHNDLGNSKVDEQVTIIIETEIDSPAFESTSENKTSVSESIFSQVSDNKEDDNIKINETEEISSPIKSVESEPSVDQQKTSTDKSANKETDLTQCEDDQEEINDIDEEDDLDLNMKNSSDVDDDEDEEEDIDDEDVDEVEDDESDGVMVLDSSDEEKERKAINKIEPSYEDDDDDDDVEDSVDSDADSDDYDDDDLMDDVVMSAKKNRFHNLPSSSKTISGNKLSKLIRQRRKMKKACTQLSYRCQAKKRSIKCLNSKLNMHNVEELHHQNIKIHNDDDNELMAIDDNDYQFSTESNSETGISLAASNTSLNTIPMKLSQESIIELDSSPEKSKNKFIKETDIKVTNKNQSDITEILSSGEENIDNIKKEIKIESIDELEDIDEMQLTEKMQPIDKIRETIQKSEDINELSKKTVGVVIIDEQNKENLGHNDKLHNIGEEANNKQINKVENICNGEKNDSEEKPITKIIENVDKIYGNAISLHDDNVIATVILDENFDIGNKPDTKLEIENNLLEPSSDLQATEENKVESSNSNLENLEKQTAQKNIIVPDDNKDNTSQPLQISRKRPRSSSIEDVQSNSIPPINTSTPIPSSKLFGKINEQQDKQSVNETENEDIHPTKKLRAELETNFRTHDRILSEYIERTSNDSPNDIDKHISQLAIEIQTLNDMIKAKEIEWNNMLHLKKVKEEICFRLTRKKQVMQLMAIKVGDIPNSQQQQQLNIIDSGSGDSLSVNNSMKTDMIGGNQNSMLKIPNINTTSSALAAMAAAASSSLYNLSGSSSITSVGSTAQTILQNRANMKSSDLAKEKVNTQKLHRNILPKPGSSSSSSSFAVTSSTTTTSTSASSIVNAHQLGISGILGSGTSPIVLTSSQNNNLPQQLQQFPLSLSNIASGSLLNHINNNSNNINNNNSLLHQQQPILNSYLTAAASVQQQLGELFNGHHQTQQQQQQNAQNLMIGRQGVFKDVKSIIADYRQRHPEQVPRRGRRMKSTNSNDIASGGLRGNNCDLSSLLNRFEGNSRPSSNDSSSHSITNTMPSGGTNITSNNVSFKDALLQIAKISGQNADRLSAAVAASSIGKSSGNMQTSSQQQYSSIGSPYPEVTLHPVSTTNVKNESTGSLLHGILTKYTRQNTSSPTATIVAPGCNNTSSSASLLVHQLNQQQTTCTPTSTTNNYNSTFSPTLARLLTAPERMANSGTQNNNNNNNSQGSHGTITAGGSNSVTNSYPNISSGSSGGLNLSKVVSHNSEITITPVVNSALNIHQSILQQQIQKQQQQQQQIKDVLARSAALTGDKMKGENIMNMDDEADDSVDRLVIDEGGDSSIGADEQYRIAPRAIGQEFNENEVPACQGCKKQEAQFVCAGCGNQWYCSRECQVQAWDEHSEVCTG